MNSKTSLIKRIFKLLFFLLLPAFIFFNSCGNLKEKTTPTVQDISESVYASGVIKAKNQYEVYSTMNGILKEVLVKEGDTIDTETPLFVIDNTVSSISSDNARLAMEISRDKTGPDSNTLRELEARLKLAKSKMENDSMLMKRQQNLWAQQVGSRVEMEQRELAYKASRTEYETVQLQYNQAKLELLKLYQQSVNNLKISEKQQSDFTIRSNMKGTIYSIIKEKGELVSIQTPLAIVGESDKFEIEMQVDEYDITRVITGQRVFITMDSYRGKVFNAEVTRVEPYMNQRTRTFKVVASFIDKPPLLYPNLTVEANVLVQKKEKVLTIPTVYLIGNKKVLTGTSDTSEVTVGIANMEWVEITKGLNKDQEIYLPVK
jgi:HlyD family secretion protein